MSKSTRSIIQFSKHSYRNFHCCSIHFQGQRILTNDNIVREQVEEKVKIYMKKYEDLFGLTKLTEIHERVLEVQKNMQNVQETRRKVQEEIFIVQKKLQEMQDILHKTSMHDDMYISVVTQVRELLKEQKRLQDVFSLYDQTEREQQTTLAQAINSSQDHERTYREKNKYLSLITGIVGTLLGLIGSSFSNWRHRKDIKVFSADISNQVSDLQKKLNNQKIVEQEDLISKMEAQEKAFQESIRTLQTLISDKNLNSYEINNGFLLDLQGRNVIHQLESNIHKRLNQHTYFNISIVSSLLVVCSVILYIGNTR